MSKITNFYYVEKLSSELFEPILENYSQLTQAYLFQDRKWKTSHAVENRHKTIYGHLNHIKESEHEMLFIVSSEA